MVSSISVVSSTTTSLSLISDKQILKNSLSLLTFFIGGFLISCSNHLGIVLTYLDVDGLLVSTNSHRTSKKTYFSCWTSNGAFFCGVGLTCGCPWCVFLSAPIAVPPLVTTTMWGYLGSTEIIWIFGLGFRFGFCTELGLMTVLSCHFTISYEHSLKVW